MLFSRVKLYCIARAFLDGDAAADQLELAGIGPPRPHHVGGAQLDAAGDGDAVRAAIGVVRTGSPSRRRRSPPRPGSRPARKKAMTVAASRSLSAWTAPSSRALRGEADRPGGEIGGDVALGEAAHGDRAVGDPRAPQPVAEQIAAGDDADREDRRRRSRKILRLPLETSDMSWLPGRREPSRGGGGLYRIASMNRAFIATNVQSPGMISTGSG